MCNRQHDYCLRVFFKSPKVKAFCDISIRLPRFAADAKSGLQLEMGAGGECFELDEADPLPKARTQFFDTGNNRCVMALMALTYFHGSIYTICTVRQTSREQPLRKQGFTTGRPCCSHIFVRGALCLLHEQICSNQYT